MQMNDESWKIDAFVDGELDLASRLELEQRLEHDEELRQRVDSLRSLREAVREKADRHRAPDVLRHRIAAMAKAASAAPAEARPASHAVAATARGWFGWLAWRPLVASTAFACMLAVAVNVVLLQSSHEAQMMQEAVGSHVRSTVGTHLVDVQSSDHHTVKPFLASKLGFSPPVSELPLPGSVFVGGRVDYFGGHPVAALVYRQGQHVVNAFVWPSTASDSKPEFTSERGYRIAHWSQGGMKHCVVSDLNREEFERLVEAVRSTSAG
jgi:anti-sigma factor RsiW